MAWVVFWSQVHAIDHVIWSGDSDDKSCATVMQTNWVQESENREMVDIFVSINGDVAERKNVVGE